MQLLKQSTAFTFRIGPFLDDTDGKTAETGLSIGQADIQISKAGGAFAQTSASPTTTHDTDGWYQCPLTTTDTGTLGTLDVQITVAGALPVWRHFMVVPAMIYDSLIAGTDVLQADMTQILGTAVSAPATAGLLDVNAIQISGDATAANNAESFFDGTGYAGTNNVIPTVTTLTGHTPQTGDSYARLGAPAGASVSADIAAVKSDTGAILTDTGTTLDALIKDIPTVAEFEARTLVAADYVVVGDTLAAVTTVGSVTGAVGSVTGNVGGSVASVTAGVTLADDAITAAKIAANAITSSEAPALANLDAAVSTRLATAGYTAPLDAAGTRTAVGLAAANLDTQLAAIVEDTGTTLDTLIKDVPTVAEFEARTLVAADYTVVSDLPSVPTAADVADAVWDEAIAGHAGAGSTGAALAAATAPSAATVADAVWDEALAGHAGAGSAGAALSAATAPSAATVADAVWDELVADHVIVGSAGASLAAAGGSGDPWSTALPGAYGAGTAGKLLADLGNSGTYSYSDTVDDGSGNLLDGVYVTLATDSGFTNIVSATHTNSLGAFTVYADTAGTHYLRLQLAGYEFTDQEVTTA